MPLAPYDGKTDLREYLAQFDHVARGNGWNTDESGIHLVATLRGAAAKVLTTMPLGATMLAGLRSALNNRFGIEQQSELVKAQLSGQKRQPHKKWEIWLMTFAVQWGSRMQTWQHPSRKTLL